MNQQRYSAYRSLLSELREWHATDALEADTYDELCDAAEGLLLSRAGVEAEEPLARASTAVLGMLAVPSWTSRTPPGSLTRSWPAGRAWL